MKASFEYKSRFTGEPCICIITGVTSRSHNRKTGAMAQVWFLLRDMAPHLAVKSCMDQGVCGSCPLRGGRGCYVRTEQAPLSIWRCWHNGGYRDELPPTVPAVRLGAYGDPASVPYGQWTAFIERLAPECWTGYTHAWRKAGWLKEWCMASTERPSDSAAAVCAGWSVFETTPGWINPESEPKLRWCPAVTRGMHCEKCLACFGQHRGLPTRIIHIPAHGARKAKVHA